MSRACQTATRAHRDGAEEELVVAALLHDIDDLLYRDHPWYQDAVDFCHRWDQYAFDPDYESLPLEFFEPMVRWVFGREPFGLAPRG